MSQRVPFDLDQIRIFRAVAKSGHFTRAAESLGMTQSAVSQQIGRLEEQLGQTLFSRTTRRVGLTPAGSTLLVYASALLDVAEQTRVHFERLPNEGVLRLGIVADFATTELHRVLRLFRQQFPRFALSVQSAPSGPLLRGLDEHELDIVLVKLKPQSGKGRQLWREPLVWVGDPTIVGPIEEPIPLVTYPAPSPSRELMLHALRDARQTWNVVAESTGIAGLVAGVESGFGIAAFGARFVPAGLKRIDEHPRLPRLGELEYSIALRDPPRHAAIDAFAGILTNVAMALQES